MTELLDNRVVRGVVLRAATSTTLVTVAVYVLGAGRKFV